MKETLLAFQIGILIIGIVLFFIHKLSPIEAIVILSISITIMCAIIIIIKIEERKI